MTLLEGWQSLPSPMSDPSMATMNISLPEPLKAFVDEQVARGVYGSTSEYVRELIRRDHERSRLRDLLLAGAESAADVDVDDAFFAALRDRARQPADG
jgi:antitoxin ParD1/3/4